MLSSFTVLPVKQNCSVSHHCWTKLSDLSAQGDCTTDTLCFSFSNTDRVGKRSGVTIKFMCVCVCAHKTTISDQSKADTIHSTIAFPCLPSNLLEMPSGLNNFKPWLQKISLYFRAKLTDRCGSGRNPVSSLQPDHTELHNWLSTLGGYFCIPQRHLKKATSRARTTYLMDHSSVPLSQLCVTIAKFTWGCTMKRQEFGAITEARYYIIQESCSSLAAVRDLHTCQKWRM